MLRYIGLSLLLLPFAVLALGYVAAGGVTVYSLIRGGPYSEGESWAQALFGVMSMAVVPLVGLILMEMSHA